MVTNRSKTFLTAALSIALCSITGAAFAAQAPELKADHSAHGAKMGTDCCTPGAAHKDPVADLDKRIAQMEKSIAEKGNFLVTNVHVAGAKGPIRSAECLALLKKDREAAVRLKNDKPSQNALVWTGKKHVRLSELPKEKAATAQTCDHNGYRWVTVGKVQWRIKNCGEIPNALRPNASTKTKVACCQGGGCCGGEGHCATTGCCKKGASCCEKSKDGTTLCNSKCGCILGCHG